MPKLPKIKKTVSVTNIGSEEHALAVARVLSGTSKREDTSRFLTVIKRWLRDEPQHEKALREWYESVPSADADDRDRPKKKKKHREEEDEE